jgi:hypothetical protein
MKTCHVFNKFHIQERGPKFSRDGMGKSGEMWLHIITSQVIMALVIVFMSLLYPENRVNEITSFEFYKLHFNPR